MPTPFPPQPDKRWDFMHNAIDEMRCPVCGEFHDLENIPAECIEKANTEELT